MPFVSVRDLTMYYEVAGRGARLLYIGGTGGDLRYRPNVFDSPLTRHFEILAFDQRGLGRTDKPDGPYSMADYAADAAGLLDALEWNRCSVLGVSFGGMVAQELALTYRERVERLVLACTSSGGAGGMSYPLHEFDGLSLEERARKLVRLGDKRLNSQWQASNPKAFQDVLQTVIERFSMGAGEPGRDMGARRQLEARKEHDTYSRLPELRMPVFICGGRYDGIAAPENLKAINRQIKGSKLEFFDGGHLFLMQDPNAYKRIIDFLKA